MARLGNNYPVYWTHSKHTGVFVTGNQKKKLPPLEILNWLFRYDGETGKLYRIRESSGKTCEPEREITAVNSNGYLCVGITDSNGLNKLFQVHQLVYYMVSGVEPLSIVDHYNGDKLNNRFDNLRLTTQVVNSRNKKMQSNNTSGITGVYWHKQAGKWMAQATDSNGKLKHLGYFEDITEAANVVQSFYANPNNNYSNRHGLAV